MKSLKRILIVSSLFLNAVFVFFLTGKVQKPVFKEIREPVEMGSRRGESSGPRVIGKSTHFLDDVFEVARIIDGDTIKLTNGNVVRYIGIDAPETFGRNECFSQEASDKNKELVLGKKVRLEKDISETDKYKRLLRYVYVGDLFVNRYLIRKGYARVSTYPPDVRYQEIFREAERKAKKDALGLWGSCGLSFKRQDEGVQAN